MCIKLHPIGIKCGTPKEWYYFLMESTFNQNKVKSLIIFLAPWSIISVRVHPFSFLVITYTYDNYNLRSSHTFPPVTVLDRNEMLLLTLISIKAIPLLWLSNRRHWKMPWENRNLNFTIVNSLSYYSQIPCLFFFSPRIRSEFNYNYSNHDLPDK